MTKRQRLAVFASAWVAATGLGSAIAVLGQAGDDGPDVAFTLTSLVMGVCLAGVGALLLGLRPGNLLGPLSYLMGASIVLELALRVYAYEGTVVHPGSVPLPDVAGWAGLLLDPLFFPVPLAFTLLMFPDGRLPSRWWRPVAALGAVLLAARILLLAIRPGPLLDETYGYAIPWRGWLPAESAALVNDLGEGLNSVAVLLLPVAAIALVVRYVRSGRPARQRLKPLALVAGAAATALVIQSVPPAAAVGRLLVVVAVAVGLPVALAVGALRYRVWDLDDVIVATIVYSGLTLLIGGGYVAVVVSIAGVAGGPAPGPVLLPSVVATALVAVAFAPVKDRLTRGARRLIHGVRATPYDSLAALPRRLAEVQAAADILPNTAGALTLGLGVPAARVRVFLDDGRESVAWSPAAATVDDDALVVVTVRHLGQVVGDVAVLPSADRILGTTERRLLADLAAQAGPALRGVAMAAQLQAQLDRITTQSEQLRASRQRISAAQAQERRRLERDIHDGAQQQLVTLAVRMRAVEELVVHGPPGAAEALAECRAELDRCLDELRQLARGIYPPVLAARGLGTALRARARLSPGDVHVATGTIDGLRFPTEVEVSAYFCCLEALQNAARHAPGATVALRLDVVGDTLTIEVTDDGPGFDPEVARASGGSGLVGMEDRISAAGGTLTIDSAPGRGTTVRGMLPLP